MVEVQTRRSVLLGLSIAALAIGTLGSDPAMAAEEEVKVYFGCGCFWHVQHEFVVAEEKILGRRNSQITSLTGYAGGTEVGRDGKVCYHNMFGDSDYGSLGHSEAVELSLPPSKFAQFAQVYMNLFINGERADPQDRGGEYRSLVGIPGGMDGPFAESLKAAASSRGLTLVAGKGNEGDTLGKKLIYVYDSVQFPFHPAEVYHQFHDDMVDKYSREYHDLKRIELQDGRLKPTGCPGDSA